MKKAIIFGFAISMLVVMLAGCGQVNSEKSQAVLNATPASTQMIATTTTAATTVPTVATTTVLPMVNPTESTNTQNKPPHAFSIRDEEKLTLMRKAVTDDEALQKLLKEDSSTLMKDREDVATFLKLLDSLPNLTIKDAVSFVIQYVPEKGYIDIWYFMGEDYANNRRYLFTYLLDKNIAQERRQSVLQEYADCTEKGQIINGISSISVLAKIKAKAETELTKRTVGYWLDVDGWLVKASYTHNQEITESVTSKEIFAPMKVEEAFQWS